MSPPAPAGFVEPTPEWICPNPGGAHDPLGESILDHEQAPCRIFEPTTTRVVIGRHQQVQREVLVDHCRSDGIPIHRRLSGGGAVVLAPGMLVIALRAPLAEPAGDRPLCAVAHAVVSAIHHCAGLQVEVCGHGDVAVAECGAPPRKVLGASLRQRRSWMYYLGVVMVAPAVPLMDRYLAAPSRQPAYREGRGHGAFCDYLGRHGLAISPLADALRAYIEPLSVSGLDLSTGCDRGFGTGPTEA